MDDSFIKRLNLDSFEPLEKLNESDRGVCPKCKAKRKFYCYDCMMSLNEDIPHLKLPVDVTVIRHPKEKKSKSSIIPSKLLAPENVEILHTIEVPELLKEGEDPESVVLMFPSEHATEISTMSKEDLTKIKRVVLIDSTWSQTRYYLRQDTIKNLKHIKINTEKTVFWRYQKGEEDTSLSTIEALYFFFRDYESNLHH